MSGACFSRLIVILLAAFFLPDTAATEREGSEKQARFIFHNLHFQNFNAHGFRSTSVTHTVHHDSKGRIWIGTESGLYLYNGNQIRTFRNSKNVTEWIPNNFTKSIAESPDGRIWIGTWGGGIAYFDEDLRRFIQPEITLSDSTNASDFDKKVWSMDIDQSGRIWIGTFTSGMYRYTPEDGTLEKIYAPSGDEPKLSNRIDTIFIDQSDRIWFTPFRDGIRVLDSKSLEPALDLPDTFKTGGFGDIAQFDDGRIVTADYTTVFILDTDGNTLHQKTVTSRTSNSQIMEILPYNENSILLGTGGASLWYLDLETNESFHLPTGKHQGAVEPSIIWGMTQAGNGDLLIASTTGVWIAPALSRQFWTVAAEVNGESQFFTETRAIMRHGGRIYLNSGSTIFRFSFDTLPKKPTVFPGEEFVSIDGHRPLWMDADYDGRFWIGTDISVFHSTEQIGSAVEHKEIRGGHTFFRDESTKRLLGSTGNKLYSIGNDLLEMPEHELHSLFDNSLDQRDVTQHLSRGSQNDIWAGGFTGLSRFDAETGEKIPALTDEADPGDWNDPYIAFVHELSSDELLLGGSNGIWHANLDKTGKIRAINKFMADHEFSSASFFAYTELSDNRILLVGDPGITEYTPNTGNTRAISIDEGFPHYNAYAAGFKQWRDGVYALSGSTGPLFFRPEEIRFPESNRKLLITDITSFRGNETVPWPIHSENLVFHHTDRAIRFRFGLLDYINPMNDHYEIKLEGFNEEWIDLGRLKEFSFTNLESGNYKFVVRVTEDLTEKISTKAISFQVLPPWWQTWWAYTLYAFVILGSLLGYFTHLRRKLLREQEISAKLREADTLKSRFLSELEIKVDEATGDLKHAVEALEIKNVELEVAQQRAQDASRLKSEFLANMSHEIRTPMNGVLGFTQLLKKSQLDIDQVEYVNTIDNSAHNLLSIINDILDISRIEAGKLIIDNTGYELRNCATEMLETLAPVAYEKNLDLVMEIASDLPLGLRGDPVRMRQVMTNLVGNAIKFTDSGHVAILLRTGIMNGEDALEIVIEDTGRGISEADRERLFQAFERGATDVSKGVVGTGLGLVITKKLTEAMGGEINLDSTPGKGTRVTLLFPLQPDRNPENRYDNIQPLAGKQVHLVDSNEASRAALHEMLLHLGAEILSSANFDASMAQQADIVACTLTRKEFDNADAQLAAMRQQAGEDKPLICFVSSMDRIRIRELGETHSALCVPRIVQLPTLVRRIEDWLRGGTDTATKSIPSPVSGMMSGMEVVIADDNRINRFFLKKMLETHGASVHEATDGREALELLTNENINVEIALIDLHMPELSGLELAERARAAGVDIPLLVVSANVLPETRKAATAAGFDGYILKPVEEDELVDTVRRYCRREVVE